MWPFRKKEQSSRVLLVKDFGTAGVHFHVRNVKRIGDLFMVGEYGDFDGRDTLLLCKNGAVRGGAGNSKWEKIDDIPGLTDGSAS